MSDTVLELDGVSISRGARTILADVRLSIGRGELVALMGASGSGKTSLLRVIAGLDPFETGSMRVGDVRIAAGAGDQRAARREAGRQIGMVFQFHHLFDHLSVLANLCLAPVRVLGLDRREAETRARKLLAELGVEHRIDARPRELSGGEAQRVAIARALAVDPRVLLMDEPTASLDASRRAELGAQLRRLTSERRTLVIATHDTDFAQAWATRILTVEDGSLRDVSGGVRAPGGG